MTDISSQSKIDKRLNAYRDDLADISLKGKVQSAQFIKPTKAVASAPSSSLRRGPAESDPVEKELLRGEKINVFEEKSGWCWVQSLRDGYVGYTKASSINYKNTVKMTHQVNSLRSLLFAEPNLKSFVKGHLSLNAIVSVISVKDKFSQLECGSWIFSGHIQHINISNLTFLEAAKLYLEAPYLWGGNNNLGVDCSGLVQMAALAIGAILPRDADMIEDHFTEIVPYTNDDTILEINDLFFWPGHVGIYAGDNMILHANATDMKVSYHNIDFLLPHIEAQEGTALRCVKRPNFPKPSIQKEGSVL